MNDIKNIDVAFLKSTILSNESFSFCQICYFCHPFGKVTTQPQMPRMTD